MSHLGGRKRAMAEFSAVPKIGRPLGRDGMLLMLTWAAGCMDSISYLALGHVFTAMMTGNTVLLGLALGQGHLAAAFRSVLALAGFCAGVAWGGLILLGGPPRGAWSRAVTRTLALESGLLVVFAVGWHFAGGTRSELVVGVLILFSGVAMGLQSAAVHHLRVTGVTTTYITGTLTSMMIGLATHASGWRREGAERGASEHRVGLLMAVFLTYAFGALVGAVLQSQSLPIFVIAPAVAVGLVVVNAAGQGSGAGG